MTNFFTSDLHIGHQRIIELSNRPFASVEEMNEAIVDNWNNEVDDNDTVYILGDLAMGKIVDSLSVVSRLKGRKILIPGNHDRVHPCYPQKAHKAEEMRRMYEDAGLLIAPLEAVHWPSMQEYQAGAQPWKLCHFPVSGDHTTEERYPEYRPTVEDGQWLIHGHVHELWRINGRQINVGVDQWDFTPVRESVINAIIDNEVWFLAASPEEVTQLFMAP